MSKLEDSRDDAQPFTRLEQAVERALSRIGALQERLREAEDGSRQLEERLRSVPTGDEDAGPLAERLHAVERENSELRDRMAKGRETVQRLQKRIRFLEEQR